MMANKDDPSFLFITQSEVLATLGNMKLQKTKQKKNHMERGFMVTDTERDFLEL